MIGASRTSSAAAVLRRGCVPGARRHHRCALALALAWLLAIAPGASAGPPAQVLRAGAGQADLTPPQTGYFLGGWTRADRVAQGQSTRLYANTLVLQRGTRKVALIAAELFAVPAGLQEDVARKVADLGYTRDGVLLAASHTHSGPGGYFPNPTYNTAAPSAETLTDPMSFIRLVDPPPADVQLYSFLVDQIAASVRAADADRAPAALGWGRATLTGIAENRSIEAHLRNHGIDVPVRTGSAAMDPDGIEHTIDPSVDVLRVDKLVRRRGRRVHVPIGAWSNFANHGTVVHSDLQVYSGDHHATAWRLFAAKVRRVAKVPARQVIVNVFPNSNEGDQTAGIAHVGPAAATFVGGAEAAAMFRAWKGVKRMSRTPALDVRWTRSCFCGRMTATGPVASKGAEGLGFITGSEEGHGALHIEQVSFEGVTSPASDPVQGNRVTIPIGNPPPAVPLSVLRVGTGAIAAVPGEATKEAGARLGDAVLRELRPVGVDRVVIAGLAGDYIQYVTTPEEYGAQSYEGATTLYGRNEGTFLQERFSELGLALRTGTAAPAAYPLDVSYGVRPDGPAFPAGAASGRLTEQPAARVERLGHATVAWDGGASGHDRPVGRAFVSAQRRIGRRWVTVDSDLGLGFLWRVDGAGHHRAEWEVPIGQPTGTYRLVVTATRYALYSDAFTVMPSTRLHVRRDGNAVVLAYPEARVNVDLVARPDAAAGGSVGFRVADRTVLVTSRNGTRFAIPAGATSVAAGAARDRYGNTNGAAFDI